MGRKSSSLKWKIRAFTLIECLIALLCMSGTVLVISGLTRLMQEQIIQEKSESQKDWQIFCVQMSSELKNSKFEKIAQNGLYVKTAKELRFGQVGNDFRKTDAKGRGYQPMLYDIKTSKITKQDDLVMISIDFEHGGRRQFIYHV